MVGLLVRQHAAFPCSISMNAKFDNGLKPTIKYHQIWLLKRYPTKHKAKHHTKLKNYVVGGISPYWVMPLVNGPDHHIENFPKISLDKCVFDNFF